MRSVLLMVLFTLGAVYFNRRGFYPPHGNPVIYAIAMSWLIAIIALPISSVFKLSPTLFSLARWETEGAVYDRTGIRVFRRALLHSPLAWINPALNLGGSRTDCERLLKEMNVAEGVHWLTCFLSSILAISCFVGDFAVYGYVMLLVRIPFDLYPIMLQRRNRGRVCRVLNRQLQRPAPHKSCAIVLGVDDLDVTRERRAAGLCADCQHARRVESSRQSTFYLCERSTTDPSFPKYPQLPVIECAGYERATP
jgi:hypothetical protein